MQSVHVVDNFAHADLVAVARPTANRKRALFVPCRVAVH